MSVESATQSRVETDVTKVHLVFKTHLDVGFTDLGKAVLQRYLSDFIPAAIRVAREVDRSGPDRVRFVWTTGSWLIWEFLEQAPTSERRLMEQAIEAGSVVWHALPFTTHSELLDLALLDDGLALSRDLDERFGRRTIAAKLTDVPGHTRGIVGPLADAGVELLHVGVNSASTLPQVPPAFRWREPAGKTVTVIYQARYGDFSAVPNCPVALAVAHTGDNHGPQSADEVLEEYDRTASMAPAAEIVGSSLNAFAEEIRPWVSGLPVVGEEIGDTWIHGAGSDPQLLAQYRALLRLNAEWRRSLPPDRSIPPAFAQSLLLVPEHTWGLDHKTTIEALDRGYDRTEFSRLRQGADYQRLERSWQEKRDLIEDAVLGLDGEPALAHQARSTLSALDPVRPAPLPSGPVGDAAASDPLRISAGGFDVGIDSARGDLVELTDRDGGLFWASERRRLASLGYEIFSAEDYQAFYRAYNRDGHRNAAWSIPDFTKPGLDSLGDERRTWSPQVEDIQITGPESRRVLLTCPRETVDRFGCPELFTVDYRLEADARAVQITVQWFDKPATRWPEALWLSFRPSLPSPETGSWWMDKLGHRVSPREVVSRGGRQLHAVGDGFGYSDARADLRIGTLDACLVRPGRRHLLRFDDEQPHADEGMHVNLYNNTWGTNFPGWSEGDALFRFTVRL